LVSLLPDQRIGASSGNADAAHRKERRGVHQNSEAVRASDQSEDYEGKNEAELAAKVRGTKIPKFGMQSARKEHSNSPLYPCP
jgi:hypothetical protein